MAKPPSSFQFTYENLAQLSGMALNTVQQHVSRQNLEPADLESVLIWLARHGTPDLRKRLVEAALFGVLPAVAKAKKKSPSRTTAKKRPAKGD